MGNRRPSSAMQMAAQVRDPVEYPAHLGKQRRPRAATVVQRQHHLQDEDHDEEGEGEDAVGRGQ